MKERIIRIITSSWFALQGAFMIFWSLYMYLDAGLKITEMFVLGCFLLPIALLFNFRKPIVKKICIALLLLYSIFADVLGMMLILVASPKIWLAWVIFFIIVSNSALILYNCFSPKE